MTEFRRVNSTDLDQIGDRFLSYIERYSGTELSPNLLEHSTDFSTDSCGSNRIWYKKNRMCNRFSLIWCQQLYPGRCQDWCLKGGPARSFEAQTFYGNISTISRSMEPTGWVKRFLNWWLFCYLLWSSNKIIPAGPFFFVFQEKISGEPFSRTKM